MPIDTRAKAKQIAGRAQQRADKLGANEDRGLIQELNYRQASKQSDRFTNVGQQMEAGTYKAPKKNRDVNKFAKGQDASNMNIEDYDFGKKYNMRDIKYLKSQGFTDDQIAKDVAARDQTIGGRQGKYLSKTGNLGMVAKQGQDEGLRSIAKSRAQARVNNTDNSNQNNDNSNQNNNNSINDSMNDNSVTNTDIRNSGNSGTGSGNSIEGNNNAVGENNVSMRDANVDNSTTNGDITITDSDVGPGSKIGYFDYGINMNSGNLDIGGLDGEETSTGKNGGSQMSAMQAGLAGAALMQNMRARSDAMNGTPMDKAEEAIARSKEIFDYDAFAQNNYNLLGQLQGAMQARATKSYADLFGDVYDGVTPPIKYGDRVTPDQPEDKTEEIADDLDI